MGWTIKDVLSDEKEKKTIKKSVSDSFISDSKVKDRGDSQHKLSLKTGENLSTGIDLLDKNLDGGFPKGSFVCIYGDPAASPEAFLYQFSTERETYYINTSRPVEVIRKDFKELHLEDDFLTFIDVYSLNGKFGVEGDDEKIINYATEKVESISAEEINIIVDSLTFFMDLDVADRLKQNFIDILYRVSKETNGLVFAYIIKDSLDEKSLKKIFDLSDVIMEILIEVTGSRYVKKFGIPKIRGRTPLNDLFKFEIGEGVQLDTSRDIA